MPPLKRSRLAVALSKTDVLAEHGLVPDHLEDSDGVRAWLGDVLGLHSLVRAMELDFREVPALPYGRRGRRRHPGDPSVTGFADRCPPG